MFLFRQTIHSHGCTMLPWLSKMLPLKPCADFTSADFVDRVAVLFESKTNSRMEEPEKLISYAKNLYNEY